MADNIFPLVDRPSPLADKIRERDGILSRSGNDIEKFANVVANTLTISDEDERAEEAAQITKEFKKSLADELDVEVDDITSDLDNTFANVLLLSKEDVIESTTLEELGLAETLEDDTNDVSDELLQNGESSEGDSEQTAQKEETTGPSFSAGSNEDDTEGSDEDGSGSESEEELDIDGGMT